MKWPQVALPRVTGINPRRPRDLGVSDEELVSFVPMAAVSELSASVARLETRPYAEVSRGFTYFAEDDVLFAKITPCMENGKSPLARGLRTGFGFGSTEFHVLRVQKRLLLPEYLHYFIRQEAFRSAAKTRMRGAAGQQRVPASFLEETLLPLPTLTEQRRIVEILDQADALRQQRRAADEKAQRILPALFYHMFGDPATNPMGWDSGTLGGFGAGVRYGLGQPPAGKATGLPLIRATNVKRGIIDDKDMMFVDPQDVPASRNAFLDADEVIVVRSGAYTGDVARVGTRWAGAVAGYDLVVTPGDHFAGAFISAMLLTPFIQKSYFANIRHRAGQPHLNASQLKATPVIVPPKPLQNRFAASVDSLLAMMQDRTSSGSRSENLLSVLMHRAFTGELTAKWREAHREELEAEMQAQAQALADSAPRSSGRGRKRRSP